MHTLNALVIASGKFIGSRNILRIVIPDFQQSFILTLFCLLGFDLLRDLHIQPVILLLRHKIDLTVRCLPNRHGIASSAKFQIHHIFETGSDAVRCIAQHAVTQSSIGKIKLILRFQNLLSAQVIARTTMKEICFLQLFQIAVHCFIVDSMIY